jgi:hypothetical protein
LNSNSDTAFAGNVYVGGGLGGGGDYPENHGMLIERGGMYAGWRSSATKHLVIFAERPAHENYSFKLCFSSVYAALPYSGANPCTEGNLFQTTSQPQWCENIIIVISSSSCPYVGPTGFTKIISRSLSDAVTLARSKGFVVDIVQPHTARNTQPDPYTPAYVENQLKTLAESTGGLYLKYDVFDEPAMRDAIWQILNHQPKLMNLSEYVPGSLLDFSANKLIPQPIFGLMSVSSGKPNLVTTTPVSGARSYGWDYTNDGSIDRLSAGPVTEHTFSATSSALMSVQAYSGPNGTGILSTKLTPYQATNDESLIYEPPLISNPESLVATRQSSSTQTVLSWDIPADAGQYGLVVVKDVATGVVLQTAPVSDGTTTIDSTAEQLEVVYVDHGAETEPQNVNVTVTYPDPEPIPEEDPPLQDTENPQDPDPIPNPPEIPIEVVDDTVPDGEPLEVVPEPEETELIVDEGVLPEESDHTGEVGQNQDKNVTQDEPNSTEDPNSPAIDTTPDPSPDPAPNTSDFRPTTSDDTATFVAAAQDTNPQSEVGGIDEVNELFKDENIGAQSESEQGSETNWLMVLVLGLLTVICLLLAWVVFKKKKKDEDDE